MHYKKTVNKRDISYFYELVLSAFRGSNTAIFMFASRSISSKKVFALQGFFLLRVDPFWESSVVYEEPQ